MNKKTINQKGVIMKKILISLVVVFCLAIVSIAQTNNSIFIPNITKEKVKQVIVAKTMQNNWAVKNDNNYSLDIYKIKDDATSMFLYGSDFNMRPEDRVHFNILERNNGVQITFNANVVTNPGSGYEKPTNAPLLESSMEKILKDLFLGNYSYNLKYTVKNKYVLVSDTKDTIYKDSNKRIGEKRKAIKVNNHVVYDTSKDSIDNFFKKCKEEYLILDIENEDKSIDTYYIKRTYVAPTYEDYL